MRILISNDDGIFAQGIKVLSETLAKEHEVYVIAPDRERSANGHALTLDQPLRVEEVTHLENVKLALKVNGTPSDSVKIAMGVILKDNLPDLVIAGINRGANVGTDIMYSGTVSAAMEGTILGYPAISVSINSFSDQHYETGADYTLNFLRNFKDKKLPPKTLLNINFPCLPKNEVKGVKITKLGVHRYLDFFEERVDLRGKTYYWVAGKSLEYEDEEDADVTVLRQGYISLTPIHYDLTNYSFINDLNSWELNF